jgi:anti-sigma regulatory factor (Ser/Thr protein kinase)
MSFFKTASPVSITFKSDPQNMSQIRKKIRTVAIEAGFDEQLQTRIILALDEAVTNVIRHAYHNDHEKEIVLSLANEPDALRISVRDFGAKPDLSKIHSRDLKDIRPGGLGCHFIREIMDEVVYDIETHAVGTELKLVKYKTEGKKGSS